MLFGVVGPSVVVVVVVVDVVVVDVVVCTVDASGVALVVVGTVAGATGGFVRRVALWTFRLLPVVCLFFVLLLVFLAGTRAVAVGRPVVTVVGVCLVLDVVFAGASVVGAVVVFAFTISDGSCLKGGTVLLVASSFGSCMPSSSSKSMSNLLISNLSISGISFSVAAFSPAADELMKDVAKDGEEEDVELLTLYVTVSICSSTGFLFALSSIKSSSLGGGSVWMTSLKGSGVVISAISGSGYK